MLFNRYFETILLSTLLLFFLLTASRALAITITAPASATVGQRITATTAIRFDSRNPACTLQIDFGDGSGWRNTTPLCTTVNCSRSLTHAYNAAGIYPIQTRGTGTCPSGGPATDLTRINVVSPPTVVREITLPDGVVGIDYEYELGDRRNRYNKITGRMDNGLKIVRNIIKGVPEREGRYRFQIRSTDPQGTTTNIWYNLKITKALLRVMVDPKKAAIDRNRAGAFRLRYIFSASEEINDILESVQGLFFAGSRRIGTINTRISTQMTKGKAQLNEQVTVPLAVIKTAQRMGLEELRYQRTFKAKYMDAATTSSMAVTVGTGFTVTRIRIYFTDDRSSKKFVKRNQKDISAEVELRYEGAGLLKGYWQADDRILARVTKNLPFANGRTMTLSLPKVPPLPTHATGSHRLRFVITNPPMNIPFPQIIYIVTGEDLATVHPIHLISPVGRKRVQESPLSFSWKSRHGVALYKVELFQGNGKKQILVFSAFSKKTTYTLPDAVQAKKLKPDSNYFWQVTGLDRNNQPIAKSRQEQFTIGITLLIHVPGRLLMLVEVNNGKSNLLVNTLIKQYNLILLEKKFLSQLGRELVLVTTTGNVEELSRKIAAENQDILVQADYFYSTLGEIRETQNFEGLLSFFQLTDPGTGKGRRVAVIDTGVDLGHRELAANIAVHANFVKNSQYMAEIHGTAVAGIIAAVADGRGTAGIAPLSSLIALRACEQLDNNKAVGRCYTSSILAAIDRAMAEKAEVVNMSIGTTAPDTMVANALNTLADSGALLLAPAGNDRRQEKLAFPASHPRVISVAGILDNGSKIPNSSVADQADCILPAQYILTILPGGRVGFMNGTSMASAMAAGLLADLHPGAEEVNSCRNTGKLISCLNR